MTSHRPQTLGFYNGDFVLTDDEADASSVLGFLFSKWNGVWKNVINYQQADTKAGTDDLLGSNYFHHFLQRGGYRRPS